jgi:hypothetical protein
MSRRPLPRLLGGVFFGLAVPVLAWGTAMSASEYKAAKDRATQDYKAAVAQCNGLSGNARDVCKAEAAAGEKKAKAEAEAQYKNTEKAHRDARIASAEADYDVARAKCGAKTRNDRVVCIKEAKAAETKAIADAKATQKVAEARQVARDEKMAADYAVAIEKWDVYSGAAKDSCVNAARARYHK